jgi:hypothetical protein
VHLDQNVTSRKFNMRLAIALLLASQVVLFAGSISAAEAPPLRLAIQSATGRPRSQAPLTVELTLTNQTETLIEGELELSIYAGRRLVQKLHSDPLALGGDAHRFRMMIPPIALHSDQTPVTAVSRFVGTRGIYKLEDNDLAVPPQWKRWFVLAISRPEEEIAYRDRYSIEAALSPERFNLLPGDLTDLMTSPAVISPAMLPATSAGYMSFDVVLAEGGGFTQLRDSQLSALAAWVEAGGSVVVRPTGVLKPGHLAFLNRLASAKSGKEVYVSDDRGRIAPASAAISAPIARYYAGLGRGVVLHLPRDREEDFRSDEWVETAMFVWKIRADQQAAIRSTEKWNFFPPPMAPDTFDRLRPFAPSVQEVESPLRVLLMPAKIQGLPFWVVVAILSVFLLLIAPGDYFLLGALRARRFTWFFLTATSLAFTMGTVRITERVMGTTDYRRGLVFADIGSGGQPLRTSRFELLFTATQKAIESRFQNELFVGIDDQHSRPPSIRARGGYYSFTGLLDDDDAPRSGLTPDLPTYTGRLPADYGVRQQMRQWSPLVSRQTVCGGTIAVPALNWDELGKLSWESTEGRGKLVETIRAVEPEAQILLFHGEKLHDPASNREVENALSAPYAPSQQITIYKPNGELGTASMRAYGSATPADPLLDLVKRASVGPPEGLFKIVSQIAPTAGDSLEDLALVDPSDERQWLLVVIVARGDDRIVFRRLYRRGG